MTRRPGIRWGDLVNEWLGSRLNHLPVILGLLLQIYIAAIALFQCGAVLLGWRELKQPLPISSPLEWSLVLSWLLAAILAALGILFRRAWGYFLEVPILAVVFGALVQGTDLLEPVGQPWQFLGGKRFFSVVFAVWGISAVWQTIAQGVKRLREERTERAAVRATEE